jgi:hypothetical protein
MLPRIMNPNMMRIKEEFRTGDPLTFHDVEARCFVHSRNAREYLKILHKSGEIRILRWRRDSPQGPWVAVYVWGPGEDAIKPSVTSDLERRRKWRLGEGVKEREAALKRSQRKMKQVVQIKSITSFMLGL